MYTAFKDLVVYFNKIITLFQGFLIFAGHQKEGGQWYIYPHHLSI